jgi:PAS domain-containing protein
MLARSGALWFEMIYDQDRQRVLDALEQLFLNQQPFEEHYRIRHQKGHWLWVRDRAIRTHAVNGVQYADGICSDVTDRKLAEFALEASEREHKSKAAELQMALEAAGAGTFDLNLATNTVNWSPELQLLYGFQPGEFRNTIEHWAECLHEEGRTSALRDLAESIAAGRGVSQFRIRRKDNNDIRGLDARGVLLRDKTGTPLALSESTPISPTASAPRVSSALCRNSLSTLKKWKPSAALPEALLTTSTTCSR